MLNFNYYNPTRINGKILNTLSFKVIDETTEMAV